MLHEIPYNEQLPAIINNVMLTSSFPKFFNKPTRSIVDLYSYQLPLVLFDTTLLSKYCYHTCCIYYLINTILYSMVLKCSKFILSVLILSKHVIDQLQIYLFVVTKIYYF